ncbi:heme/hemin ABC transporter substrate-binding protein [Algoriphagus sediminis]|uniref:ABC transporter substrate-binding protein n=1 Tax=Algoriphagus sediminis TaxID=3057113 RepID=A0ABT7YF89_9BACT|nr:ABC transporter substrate-binding protein [Algoriphagus sediminis]MDN3205193.1 ABC transporter substrate-binding protein [Algoriphagus sediminis]
MIVRILFVFSILLAACSPQAKEANTGSSETKIITAGGTVTEVVHALGFGDQIIATDITSTYPASMQDLPSIGYRNQIKAEGILALGPDLVLMEEGCLSDDVVEQLKAAQIDIRSFAKPKRVQETYTLIDELGSFLDAETQANDLKESIGADLAKLEEYLQSQESQPKGAFIMARGPQTVFLAGEKTFAEEIFGLAKINYASTGFDDFVPLTPEALVKINPDYLVFFESGVQSLGGEQGLASIQGMTEITAFKEGNIVALDGNYLSGFGPRVGKAALDLAKAVRE